MKMIIAGLIIVLVSTMGLVNPVNAVIFKEACFNNTHERITSLYNLTETGDEMEVGFVQTTECINGCSTALGKCREDPFNEIVFLFVLIAGALVFCGLSVWFSYKTDTEIDIPLLILVSVFSILIGAQDVFSSNYRTIVLLFSIIPLVLLWYTRRENVQPEIESEAQEVEIIDND